MAIIRYCIACEMRRHWLCNKKKKKKKKKSEQIKRQQAALETEIRSEVTIKIIAGILLLMAFHSRPNDQTNEKRKIYAT